jgi:hypothetical protein
MERALILGGATPLDRLAGWLRQLAATVFSTSGKAIVSGRMIGATPSQAEAKFIGIGSGAGTAAVGDTTLFTEFTTGTWTGYARVTGTLTQQTTTLTNDTYRCVGTFTAPAAEAVTNAGLFDALTTGNLLIKGDFATVNLALNDTLTLTFNLQFS